MKHPITVFDNLEKYDSSIALIDTFGSEISYSELVNASNEYLRADYRGRLIFFLGDNDLDSVISYIGLIKCGATLMLLSPDTSQEKIDSLCAIYRPNYIWKNLNSGGDSVNYKLTPYIVHSEININPDLSLLLSTSGSTGSPKFVRLSHKNIIANTNSIIEGLGISESDCAITTLPFNYSYGLSIITTHLVAGARIVLSKFSVIERNFWELVKREKVTTFGGVPYTYQMLSRMNTGYFANTSIKYLTQAGGKLSTSLVNHFLDTLEKSSASFVVMYGQTEATARMSIALPKHLKISASTIGQPIAKGKFNILDSNLQIISDPNVPGEIEYCGENVCLGFSSSASDLSLGDTNQGKLRTGDLGYFDEHGLYYVTGRNNRFLKLFGNRINLDDVQDHLASKGIVAACVGAEDNLNVFLENSGEIDIAIATVSEFLNIHRSAVKTNVISKLPRSESGKLLYAQLTQHA